MKINLEFGKKDIVFLTTLLIIVIGIVIAVNAGYVGHSGVEIDGGNPTFTSITTTGDVKVGGDLNMSGNRIVEVPAPNNPGEVANRAYVDAQAGPGGGDSPVSFIMYDEYKHFFVGGITMGDMTGLPVGTYSGGLTGCDEMCNNWASVKGYSGTYHCIRENDETWGKAGVGLYGHDRDESVLGENVNLEIIGVMFDAGYNTRYIVAAGTGPNTLTTYTSRFTVNSGGFADEGVVTGYPPANGIAYYLHSSEGYWDTAYETEGHRCENALGEPWSDSEGNGGANDGLARHLSHDYYVGWIGGGSTWDCDETKSILCVED